jgi:uncharacterized protein (TIGR04255 family)
VRAEYPVYQRQQMPFLPEQIADFVSSLPMRPSASIAHQFSTSDLTRSITLAPDFLAITESDYDEWPVLRPQIAAAQATLEEIYVPAFYSRVGLRYQDVIDREHVGVSDRDWHELVNPQFNGLLGTAETSVRECILEYGANALVRLDGVDAGKVRIQYGLARRTDSPLVPAPPDAPFVFLIDADYYTEARHERGAVLGTLDNFRTEAGNLFRWAISPALRDALGRRHVEQGVGT